MVPAAPVDRADFSQAGPTTAADVTKAPLFSSAVDDVVTKLHTGVQSVGLPPTKPSAPDMTPQARVGLSSFTTMNPAPVTAFAGSARNVATQAKLVETTVTNLFASLGGISGSGGSPVAPGPVLMGALQLIRRELDQPECRPDTDLDVDQHPLPPRADAHG